MNNRHFRLQGIRQAQQTANRNVGKLFLIGLASVAAYNWQRWQRDKALAERLRAAQTPAPALDNPPQVSALVAAWNEVEHIDAHIQSFLALRYPNIELVLCAGGYDGTLAKARLYAGERVIVIEQHAGEGKQKALARCYEHAHGDVIYLTDADCRFDDDALARLLGPIVNEGEHAATGGFAPLPEQRQHPFVFNQWAVDTYARRYTGTYSSGLIGRNAAVTARVLQNTGALAEDVRIGTDYYLAKQLIGAGYQIRYVADSVVVSQYHTLVGPYIRQQIRWLRNIVIHGYRFAAWQEVIGALRNCIIGSSMLMLPLIGLIFSPFIFVVGLLGLIAVCINRLRYLMFIGRMRGEVPTRAYLLAPMYAVLDLYMLLQAGLNIILTRRNVW